MRIKAEHIILLVIDIIVLYFFYTNVINQYVLGGILLVSFYFLTRIQNTEDRITLRQAKDLTMNEVLIAQQKGEIPPGTPFIFDGASQEYVFEDQFRPWKYLIGVKVCGDQDFYYMSAVSLNGSHLRLSPKDEGWKFDDEFKIIEIEAPGVETKNIPPSQHKVIHIGGG